MNKWLFVLVFTTISTLSFSQKKKVSVYDLDQINGLFYQRNTVGAFTGLALEEHSNGKKKMSVPIKEGKFQGVVKEWAKDGTKIYESEYDKGKQHGRETQWYATGQKKVELNYIQGEPNGICTEWHKNGKKKSEGNFSSGKEDGQHNWWFANGQLDQQATYTNGETNGTVKNWHLNGQLKMESQYKVGVKDGLTKKWFEDGTEKSEEYFINDKPEKEAKYWSSKGILHTIRVYEKGRLVQEKNYRSGNINVGDGYVQVYNELESFFKVPVRGGSVRPVDMKNITYVVDGDLLQLFNVPTKRFAEILKTDEKQSNLDAYIEYENLILKESEPDFEFEIKKEVFKTDNNLEAVHWYFEPPSKFAKEQTKRTVQEKHYISILCNQQVLSLHSAVTKSDDAQAIKKMLMDVANEVVSEKERIDLNVIIAQLQD